MWQLIEASMFTSIVFIANMVTKRKKDVLYYLTIFLTFAGISFLLDSKVQAGEIGWRGHIGVRLGFFAFEGTNAQKAKLPPIQWSN